jgi:hypothetical protein
MLLGIQPAVRTRDVLSLRKLALRPLLILELCTQSKRLENSEKIHRKWIFNMKIFARTCKIPRKFIWSPNLFNPISIIL